MMFQSHAVVRMIDENSRKRMETAVNVKKEKKGEKFTSIAGESRARASHR